MIAAVAILLKHHNRDYALALSPSPVQMHKALPSTHTISKIWLGTGDQSTVKRRPFGGDTAMRIGQNSLPAQAKYDLSPVQCHAALPRNPRTL